MTKMQCPKRLRELLPAITGAIGILYPFLVYFARARVPPVLLVALAMALGAWHLLRPREQAIMPRWSFFVIPGILLALLAARPALAMQAYPPLVSLCLAGAFAWSLAYPPSAIERIARLTHPRMTAEMIAYTRTVTKVWIAFFLANASIATICAVWFTVAIWTLWTGLVSYLLIGALFLGEWIVRRWKMERAAS
jgi:uncharacterized membrane protein